MPHLIPATTLRYHLGDALKAVLGQEKFILITKKNKPVSALVNLDFFEDLLALASPSYRKSIREAREDFRRGRLFTHAQVFGQLWSLPSYQLLYTRRGVKDMAALDSLTKRRLSRKLLELSANPLRLSEKLINPKIGQYRCRVGNYRVIFDLHGTRIVILRVGHRREIYR